MWLNAKEFTFTIDDTEGSTVGGMFNIFIKGLLATLKYNQREGW